MNMTKWLSCLTIAAILGCAVPQARASQNEPVAIISDLVLVRPAGLVATVVGSAFFVVSLPFAALSKSTKATARTLVEKPYRTTFVRTLGDLDSISE
jgi:hypothetical protein